VLTDVQRQIRQPAQEAWRVEPKDLSGNLIVQLGAATEDLTRDLTSDVSPFRTLKSFGSSLMLARRNQRSEAGYMGIGGYLSSRLSRRKISNYEATKEPPSRAILAFLTIARPVVKDRARICCC